MNKLETVRVLLKELHLPVKQQSDMCCLTFLALVQLRDDTPWEDAKNPWLRIHDLLAWMNFHLGVSYAENTRETVRKTALHFFRDAAIIEDNGMATNSPNYSYRLTEEVLLMVQHLASGTWRKRCALFLKSHRSLVEKYADRRVRARLPVSVNSVDFVFSPGRHNELQKAILEEFVPRFSPGSRCLYVGDADNKSLILERDALSALGVDLSVHGKLPDIVLYSSEKNWLFFVEAVVSCGPISPARKLELEKMTLDTTAGVIFVSAFPNFKSYHRFSRDLAWETEVWIADQPEHLIHLNGDRFLGPRSHMSQETS